MSNDLSLDLIEQLTQEASTDPFLTLVTLEHPSFVSPIRLVNNIVNITSRSNVFYASALEITLPSDDGETSREIQLALDNVTLEHMVALRTAIGQVTVKLEMILASLPNDVQLSFEDLKISSASFNKTRITTRLFLDNFLNTELTSEKYLPSNFRGLF